MFSSLANLFQAQHQKVSFEDMQYAILHTDSFFIINTLSVHEQDCLIKHTLDFHLEEQIVNDLLKNYTTKTHKIILYGKHSNDVSVDKKYSQLLGLGFSDVYIYGGGLFEWLLLQDIYGDDEFPTTRKMLDILKYKPPRRFGIRQIGFYS